VIHHLKIWPVPFTSMLHNDKAAEFRINDRDFHVADQVLFTEWDHKVGAFTGRSILAVITDVQRGPDWGIPEGYAVLSIRLLSPIQPWTIDA